MGSDRLTKENVRVKEIDITSFSQITKCLGTEDSEIADALRFHIDPC